MNTRILERHLIALSNVYVVDISSDCQTIIIRDWNPPPGYQRARINLRLELPDDYPVSPPGAHGSALYVPVGLRYRGKKPKDLHEELGPAGWAWWCYENVNGWDPCRDDLITFFEMLRAHMTDPPC